MSSRRIEAAVATECASSLVRRHNPSVLSIDCAILVRTWEGIGQPDRPAPREIRHVRLCDVQRSRCLSLGAQP